ncbi:hypothetical protein SCAR479_07749 [Seiridium cardinale]|uniref:Uncharacterized protein n=1 Tax=Seiridium cardinale TaxID=138064 RepID=A0ABR2XPP4_9PEZI
MTQVWSRPTEDLRYVLPGFKFKCHLVPFRPNRAAYRTRGNMAPSLSAQPTSLLNPLAPPLTQHWRTHGRTRIQSTARPTGSVSVQHLGLPYGESNVHRGNDPRNTQDRGSVLHELQQQIERRRSGRRIFGELGELGELGDCGQGHKTASRSLPPGSFFA